MTFSASCPLKLLRHRLGSEPPTGSEDDDLLHADAGFNLIFGTSAMHYPDGVFNHFKPTLAEVLPLHCNHTLATPLLQFTGDMPVADAPRSSSRYLTVNGCFFKDLAVSLLL
jgi:hypothetical protein